MNNWKTVKLGDVCSLNMGQSPNSNTYNKNGIGMPFFQGNADFGAINPTVKHWCSKPVKIANVGDILISVRAPIGALNIAGSKCCIGRGLAAITVDKSEAERDFIWYILKSKINELQSKGTGSTFKAINKTTLYDVSFVLPPLEIQKQIAENLDKVTHAIDLCNAILEKLDLLVKARFVEMFGDIETNTLKWSKMPMGNYMTLLTDFSANGSYEYLDSNVKMYDEPNYALMVRTTDLEKNDFENDVKYIDKKAYNILSKSKIFGNEIIMNKIGSAGKIYLMPVLNKPVSLGRNAFMFRFNSDINVVFLYHLLISEYGTKEIQQHIRGAVTKTITKDAARSIRIIVPPIELQIQFADFVTQTDKTKSKVKQTLEKAETLKKALMQEYFR